MRFGFPGESGVLTTRRNFAALNSVGFGEQLLVRANIAFCLLSQSRIFGRSRKLVFSDIEPLLCLLEELLRFLGHLIGHPSRPRCVRRFWRVDSNLVVDSDRWLLCLFLSLNDIGRLSTPAGCRSGRCGVTERVRNVDSRPEILTRHILFYRPEPLHLLAELP
jgi:hypothetical protein